MENGTCLHVMFVCVIGTFLEFSGDRMSIFEDNFAQNVVITKEVFSNWIQPCNLQISENPPLPSQFFDTRARSISISENDNIAGQNDNIQMIIFLELI